MQTVRIDNVRKKCTELFVLHIICIMEKMRWAWILDIKQDLTRLSSDGSRQGSY